MALKEESVKPRSGRGRLGVRLFAVTAAATLLAACGSTPSDTADEPAAGGGSSEGPIKVGAIQSVTGPLAPSGIPEQHATEAAIKAINDNGGIDGRELELVFYDAAGDTTTAVNLTRRLIQEDEVDLVVGGGTSSGIALAMKPILQQAGIFFMSTEAADQIVNPAAEAPLTFASTLSTNIVVQAMMENLKEQGVKKVGVLADSTAYGQSGIDGANAASGSTGIEVVAATYDPASTDLTPDINKLTDAGVEAYINWTSGTSGVLFMQNAQTLDLQSKGPVMLSFTFSNPAMMKQGGAAAEGITVAGVKATVYQDLDDSDEQKAGLEELAAAIETYDEIPTIQASQTWDAMNIAAAAIEEAGSTEGSAIAKALEGLTHVGTQGTYEYSADDHRGLDTSVPIIMTWDGTKHVAVED
jgi:branched-chain amino acid transport system substrate-binding protein